MTMLPDAILIQKIKKGGKEGDEALSEIYESNFYMVENYVKRYKLSEQEVLSVYTDAVLAVKNAILANTYAGTGLLKAYLGRIVAFKCIDVLRAQSTNKKGRKEVDIEQVPLYNETENQEEMFILEEENQEKMKEEDRQRKMLKKAMSMIAEKCRNVLIDYIVKGLKPRQICEKYPEIKNANVARSTIYTCRKKLLQYIHQMQLSN